MTSVPADRGDHAEQTRRGDVGADHRNRSIGIIHENPDGGRSSHGTSVTNVVSDSSRSSSVSE